MPIKWSMMPASKGNRGFREGASMFEIKGLSVVSDICSLQLTHAILLLIVSAICEIKVVHCH